MEQHNFQINESFVKKGIELALINANNLDTGFITLQKRNTLNKNKLSEIVNTLQDISLTKAKFLETHNIVPSMEESGMIFQHFFTKSVEIFYKQYYGIEIDSVSFFNIREAFEFYEPDLPYNVQQILNNRLWNIAALTTELWSYMEKNGIFNTPFSMWFANYLSLATTLGLAFAQEIDFNDQSELNAFLNIDQV